MYDDKLITTYHEKTKVLTVKSNNTIPFAQKIEFGRWYQICDKEDKVYFTVQLIKEDDGKYVFNVQGLDESDQPEKYDIYDILNNQDTTIIEGNETKFVLVDLHIQNGEYEYKSKSVHEIPAEINADAFGDEYAKGFYGKYSHSDRGSHYFNGGEVAVESKGTVIITPDEYEILNKFLI
jgi:hypothetical protein